MRSNLYFTFLFFHSIIAFCQLTRVSDICPGPCSSNIKAITLYNNAFYFQAHTSTNGNELWKYNETEGATIVKDIFPGTGDSNPYAFVAYKDMLYFIAFDGTTYKLYSCDGAQVNPLFDYGTSQFQYYPCTIFQDNMYIFSSTGTYLYTGTGTPQAATDFSSIPFQAAALSSNNDYLYFYLFAPDGGSTYRYDGVNVPMNTGLNFRSTAGVFFKDEFYFPYRTNAMGEQLWRIANDGTSELACDLDPSSNVGFYLYGVEKNFFFQWDDTLYFGGSLPSYGIELVKYDGVNPPKMIGDLNPGALDSNPMSFTVWNNTLYFLANDITYGIELWKYDRVSPPERVSEFSTNGNSVFTSNLTLFNNALYIAAQDDTHGIELWRYDGISPPALVEDVAPGTSSFLREYFTQQFFTLNNKLYMAGNGADGYGDELWRYDGIVTSIDLEQKTEDAILYPNPKATDQPLSITYTDTPEQFIVINTQGIEVYRGHELPHLNIPGLYKIQVLFNTKKIIQTLLVY